MGRAVTPGPVRVTITRRRLLAITCLGAGVTDAHGQPADPVFDVRISISPADRPPGILLIDAAVTNRGGENQPITVWTQEGWSWVCDNPAFRPAIDTLKNESRSIVLAPGQQRRSVVTLLQDLNQPGTGSLRLGFAPQPRAPLSTQTDVQAYGGVTWSNRVELVR